MKYRHGKEHSEYSFNRGIKTTKESMKRKTKGFKSIPNGRWEST
jgi:hypothetical protein